MSGLQGGYIGKDGLLDALIGSDFSDYSEISVNGNDTQVGVNGAAAGRNDAGLGTIDSGDLATFVSAIQAGASAVSALLTGASSDHKALATTLIAGNYYRRDGGSTPETYTYSKITAENLHLVKFDTAVSGGDSIGNVYLARGERTGIEGLEQEINEASRNTSVASASDALRLQLHFIRYSSQITAVSQIQKAVGDAVSATSRNIG